MNRLGMSVALVLSLVAGCLANDQADPGATTTSSQDLTTFPSTTLCYPNDTNTCIFPTPWNPTITAVDQYWAGAGTSNPAKVMITFLYPTKADPVTGLATAYYAFLVAGYESCSTTATTCGSTNTLAKFYEVPASLLGNYRAAERLARDTQEMANPILALWDGGAGGPLVGHPGGPVGPGGLPWALVNTLKGAAANVRSGYVNVYNVANAGTRGTGIAAP